MIKRIKALIKRVIFHFITIPQKVVYKRNSYSQAGEDAIISFLVTDKKLKTFSYLDLGTNKPISGNNTYLFYNRGYKGACVEADKNLISRIKEHRPHDAILNAGVSVLNEKNEISDFYIFDEPSLNTFDKTEALSREKHGTFKIKKVEKVRLISINEIISNYFNQYPDFLSIDIEGLDLKVLKSLDIERYPIPIICAETCTYSENHIRPKDNSIIEFMQSKNYMVYADTYINTIFVNKEWFYQK